MLYIFCHFCGKNSLANFYNEFYFDSSLLVKLNLLWIELEVINSIFISFEIYSFCLFYRQPWLISTACDWYTTDVNCMRVSFINLLSSDYTDLLFHPEWKNSDIYALTAGRKTSSKRNLFWKTYRNNSRNNLWYKHYFKILPLQYRTHIIRWRTAFVVYINILCKLNE